MEKDINKIITNEFSRIYSIDDVESQFNAIGLTIYNDDKSIKTIDIVLNEMSKIWDRDTYNLSEEENLLVQKYTKGADETPVGLYYNDRVVKPNVEKVIRELGYDINVSCGNQYEDAYTSIKGRKKSS